MATFSKTVEVINQYGIHARPAALLVKTASGFQSDICASTAVTAA